MSVLLVEPRCPVRFSQNPTDFASLVNREINLTPPVGLGYLAAVLKKEGLEVAGIDLNSGADPTLNLLNKIKQTKPIIIGLSVNFTVSTKKALLLAQIIKKSFPDLIIVAGGNQATFRYQDLLNSGLDIVVLYEGEQTFLELVKKILQDGPTKLEKINGLAFKDKNNQIITTPRRPFIENLDELPFPLLELFTAEKYGLIKTYPLVTSRGCSKNCYFCAASVFCQKKLRPRSAANVKAEIELAVKAGYKNFNFSDDNFSFSADRVREICNALGELGITWSANCCLETLDRQLLGLMKTSGCQQLRIGVESGSDTILPKIKHGLTKAKVLEFLGNSRAAGIDVVAGFMFPHYSDTPATADETKEFTKEAAAAGAMVNFYLTTPFPGTPLFENPEFFKVKIFETDWDKYDSLTPTFETAYFDRIAIAKKFREIEEIVIELNVTNVIRLIQNHPVFQNLPFKPEVIIEAVKQILKH